VHCATVEVNKKLSSSWFDHRYVERLASEGADIVNRSEAGESDKRDLVTFLASEHIGTKESRDGAH
jgi:hypothetical protein